MAIPLRVRWAEWVAGLFVLGAFVAVLGAMFLLTHGRGGLSTGASYEIVLDDGHGIAPGGPVKMLGIPIGTIETVEITEDNHVRATIEVESQFADRIREDSVARIEASLGLEGMLAGVGFVVTPGSAGAGALADGARLAVIEPENVTELLPGVADDPMFADAQALLHNLRALSDQIADEKSDVRRLLASAAAVTAMVEKGDGTVGKLLADEGELYARMLETMDRVDETLAKARGMMGRSGGLLTKAEAVVDDADGVMESADTTMQTATGVFKKMDPVMDDAGDAMKDLGVAVEEFTKTTEKLGKLLEEMDQVVADMATVAAAAKKVWPIRRHIRGDRAK